MNLKIFLFVYFLLWIVATAYLALNGFYLGALVCGLIIVLESLVIFLKKDSENVKKLLNSFGVK